MTACARGCRHWRRHTDHEGNQPWLSEDDEPCPVPNGQDGAWVSVFIQDEDTRAELRLLSDEELEQATGFQRGRYGQLERWHECRGCQPREAKHGVLCDQCFTRLQGWFAGEVQECTYTPKRGHPKFWAVTRLARQLWTPTLGVLIWQTGTITERPWVAKTGSLAWCWGWLEGDMVPGQVVLGAKAKRGKKDAPPAAMSVAIHDLRQDILTALGTWMGSVTAQFTLSGPTWWRHRMDEARRRQEARSHDAYAPYAELEWRAWLPQDAPFSPKDATTEIQDACRYLAGWLDRICENADVMLPMYELAAKLHRRVKTVAPWEATAKRLPDLRCPVCDREALVRWEGDEHLVCRRCSEIVPRQRYDIWSAGLEQEAGRRAS